MLTILTTEKKLFEIKEQINNETMWNVECTTIHKSYRLHLN